MRQVASKGAIGHWSSVIRHLGDREAVGRVWTFGAPSEVLGAVSREAAGLGKPSRQGGMPKFVAICRGGSRAARLTTKSACSDGRFTNRPYKPPWWVGQTGLGNPP